MEPKAEMEKTFRTHDLSLGAALLEVGQRFIEIRENKGSVLFVFEDSEPLRTAVLQYLDGGLRVRPQTFLVTWKRLRSMISDALKKEV